MKRFVLSILPIFVTALSAHATRDLIGDRTSRDLRVFMVGVTSVTYLQCQLDRTSWSIQLCAIIVFCLLMAIQ